MADIFLVVYFVSVIVLVCYGWHKRRSDFLRHASAFEWLVVAVLTFCPVINTAVAINALWRWIEKK